jgi:hypothetical protein
VPLVIIFYQSPSACGLFSDAVGMVTWINRERRNEKRPWCNRRTDPSGRRDGRNLRITRRNSRWTGRHSNRSHHEYTPTASPSVSKSLLSTNKILPSLWFIWNAVENKLHQHPLTSKRGFSTCLRVIHTGNNARANRPPTTKYKLYFKLCVMSKVQVARKFKVTTISSHRSQLR